MDHARRLSTRPVLSFWTPMSTDHFHGRRFTVSVNRCHGTLTGPWTRVQNDTREDEPCRRRVNMAVNTGSTWSRWSHYHCHAKPELIETDNRRMHLWPFAHDIVGRGCVTSSELTELHGDSLMADSAAAASISLDDDISDSVSSRRNPWFPWTVASRLHSSISSIMTRRRHPCARLLVTTQIIE